MSKLRTDQLETLDGLHTKNVEDLVVDINTSRVTTSTGEQTLADALDGRITKGEVGVEEVDTPLGAETVQDALTNRFSVLSSSEAFTVGTTGDFETLQDAVDSLQKRRPSGDVSIVLTILSGHEISYKTIVKSSNLSYIVIESEDSEVPIIESSLSGFIDGRNAAFYSLSGATFPTINCLFTFDSQASGGRDGLFVNRGSGAIVLPGAGIKNSSNDNLHVSRGSWAVVDGGIFTGAVDKGVTAVYSSSIDASGADCSGAQNRCAYFTGGSRGNVGEADLSNGGNRCLQVGSGSQVFADGSICTGGGEYGVFCTEASQCSANGVDASGAGIAGFFAQNGSTIQASSSVSSNGSRRGYWAVHGSTISARSCTSNNNAEEGLYATDGSTITARGATATGNNVNVSAQEGSTIDARGGVFTGYTTSGVTALGGSHICIILADVRQSGSPSSTDIRVLTGSIISASGASGGTDTDVNTLSPSGIIFQ